MGEIKASDVNKLRQMTGAGMMDCKKALGEADGDFEKAVEVLRKKGQKVANNRAERSASEGVVMPCISDDNTKAVMLVLNCETDFVAKNEQFIQLTEKFAKIAINNLPNSMEELLGLSDTETNLLIRDLILDKMASIGEKIEISNYCSLEYPFIVSYIHPGNKLASLVAFNKVVDKQVGKDIAMQVAAMNPVAIDKDGVSVEIISKEMEIAKEIALGEGKSMEMAEKISIGKLNKFYQEQTLINQQFIKDNKKTIKEYIQGIDKDLKILDFKRYLLAL